MLLYTNILPLKTDPSKKTVRDYFHEMCSKANTIYIASGYASRTSLCELRTIVSEYDIKKITVTLGMYSVEGIPESLYNEAKALHKEWTEQGVGEIRIVNNMKFHGKLYTFYKDGQPLSTIVGSANLGAIVQDAGNIRQYETASSTENPDEVSAIQTLIDELNSKCTSPLNDTILKVVREENMSLTGVDTVKRVPKSDVDIYDAHKTSIVFKLPIKVPAYNERHMDDNKHYTKSNLNVCYAAPRSKRKNRDWYETQFTVSNAITEMDGYPQKNVPFYAVTDDGYMFKVHTTSDHNKQFSAVGDELILGRWVKGRIAAAGLVTPVNDTGKDPDRTGMITKEMLKAYGCNCLMLTKTDKTVEEDGQIYEVWTLSFEADTEGDE